MGQETNKRTRVLIVDDHIILRDGIVSLFRSQPDFEVVGEAGSVAESLAAAAQHKPDLILMDYGLPDGTGLEATRAILADHPGINIVFLTVHEEDDQLFSAIRSGARGYLLKNIPAEVMLQKLRGLSRGEAPISGQMTSRVLGELAKTPPPAAGESGGQTALLTRRELEVLREVARGATNKEIARRLFISVHTVRNHMHNILEKMGVSSRSEAAKRLVENGMH
jgi:two-component system nitrate/nitrite response regulator NarL